MLTLEANMLARFTTPYVATAISITMPTVTLSLMSYCQIQILGSYIITTAYNMARTSTWISDKNEWGSFQAF